MKKRFAYIFMLVALLSACQELEVDKYENDPRLYFYRAPFAPEQRDSISHSFFLQEAAIVRDTVLVEVRTMGFPSSEPRAFKIKQINADAPNAAQAGVHYISFDTEEIQGLMQVLPGQVSTFVPVVLLRDPSLKQTEMRLEITIAENEYFKPGIQDNAKFTVTVSDFAVMPASWARWQISFGAWGAQKMFFVSNYLGVDLAAPVSDDYDLYLYYQGMAKDALSRYNSEHPGNPLEEADGTPVTF
ncbi:MAG: DUF4843 domain-containing protein [Odoribacteraceae bacterium]|jgi:hypothetical protein|nr:DUF4843 domain-containing protein [Odoribacteraceae bacterium]